MGITRFLAMLHEKEEKAENRTKQMSSPMADCPCSYPRIDHVLWMNARIRPDKIARRARTEEVPAIVEKKP